MFCADLGYIKSNDKHFQFNKNSSKDAGNDTIAIQNIKQAYDNNTCRHTNQNKLTLKLAHIIPIFLFMSSLSLLSADVCFLPGLASGYTSAN